MKVLTSQTDEAWDDVDEADSVKCHLENDPREFRVGAVWHPYLPMLGFSKCATCTCEPGGITNCTKLPCPEPNCPQSQWIRADNQDCCYVCGGE